MKKERKEDNLYKEWGQGKGERREDAFAVPLSAGRLTFSLKRILTTRWEIFIRPATDCRCYVKILEINF